MRAIRLAGSVAALCMAGTIVYSQQPANQVTVSLSDPARPATLDVQAVAGSITVRGSNRRDVLVTASDRGPLPGNHGRGRNQRNQRDESGAGSGLRQLAQPPAFTIDEARNSISIQTQSVNRIVDYEIQVPSRTNLKLASANSGEIVVEGVEGEIEINNPTGAITLNKVGGSIVANTVNGQVRATITSLSMQPTALTSLLGHIDVTFPVAIKANLKLRSDTGNVLTDFDVTPLPQPTAQPTRREDGQIRIESNRHIYGTVNGGGPEIELRTFSGNVYVRRAQ
jgi:hypothetical protein